MTGPTKKGPKRLSNSIFDRTAENVSGFMVLDSDNSYIFFRNSIFCWTVWTSVVNPDNPNHNVEPFQSIF